MADTVLQPFVDRDALQALREIMAEGFAPLLEEFQQQLNSGVDTIVLACGKADYPAIKSCAHQLKGSALDMACNSLAQTLACIEQCASAANHEQLTKAIDALQKQLPDTLRILATQS
jgi:HPt (histidine-containing phosphotransfer) domain-containing protein